MDQSNTEKKLPTQKDYKFGREIGCGSFSKVFEAMEIETGRKSAIKVVEKEHAVKNKAVNCIMMERHVLKITDSPYIVKLYCTFHDSFRLYFDMELAANSEISKYLNSLSNFSIECTQFYVAEILSALLYLHEIHIVHRDLKPENILLSSLWHVKLADFGSAIVLNDDNVKAESFTGTPQYVSPEMLSTDKDNSNKELVYLMDYWALGCIIYHFLAGLPPFRFKENETNEFVLFGRISKLDYEFVEGFDPTGKDLVQKLLVLKPEDRLGSPTNGGPNVVMNHPFFKGIEWKKLLDQTPPKLASNLSPLQSEATDWDKIPNDYEQSQQYHLSKEFNMSCSTTDDLEALLKKQYKTNVYHRFTKNRLIIKQGVLYKRRGLFSKKRMFLLTEGPHLFYIDMETMEKKGEVPWSTKMSVELKNDRMFYIHVPGRTYYLENPSKDSFQWLDEISKLYARTYKDDLEVILPKKQDK